MISQTHFKFQTSKSYPMASEKPIDCERFYCIRAYLKPQTMRVASNTQSNVSEYNNDKAFSHTVKCLENTKTGTLVAANLTCRNQFFVT